MFRFSQDQEKEQWGKRKKTGNQKKNNTYLPTKKIILTQQKTLGT